MNQFSQSSLTTLKSVNDSLQIIAIKALEICPLDFGIPSTGGLRTEAQQNILFRNGKSKCDGFIRKSKHQSGEALDFYALINGKASWDKYHLTIVAASLLEIASREKISIKWGGHFKPYKLNHGWDLPHIELIGNS